MRVNLRNPGKDCRPAGAGDRKWLFTFAAVLYDWLWERALLVPNSSRFLRWLRPASHGQDLSCAASPAFSDPEAFAEDRVNRSVCAPSGAPRYRSVFALHQGPGTRRRVRPPRRGFLAPLHFVRLDLLGHGSPAAVRADRGSSWAPSGCMGNHSPSRLTSVGSREIMLRFALSRRPSSRVKPAFAPSRTAASKLRTCFWSPIFVTVTFASSSSS